MCKTLLFSSLSEVADGASEDADGASREIEHRFASYHLTNNNSELLRFEGSSPILVVVSRM